MHVVENISNLKVDDQIECNINWGRRFNIMQVHTTLHLLCSLISAPVTGGQINENKGRLDFDLDINTGSSNVFDIDINADDVTWNVDIIGSSNNWLSNQSDGAYNSLTVEYIGSNGDIDIIQSSGTCPSGVSGCYGIINADFDTENGVVDIKQKDTGD